MAAANDAHGAKIREYCTCRQADRDERQHRRSQTLLTRHTWSESRRVRITPHDGHGTPRGTAADPPRSPPVGAWRDVAGVLTDIDGALTAEGAVMPEIGGVPVRLALARRLQDPWDARLRAQP